ncbi:apolipoprotein D-like [Pecten maximus]|uniref:apolipoprotein D-like n=1 Tax=Pecten maximus TaxID=6579 RepID=UPI001458D546|nr:apolipoprotein D-like [Pecten maximus]
MKQMYLFLTISFAVLALTTGQRLRARCPNVDTKPDFNISRYEGDWFEDRRSVTRFQFGLTCSKANYVVLGNGDIRVTNTGITKWFQYAITVTGIATVPDSGKPGRLSISFNGGDPGPYLVLDTDYDNFALVYTCKSYGLFATETLWVLKRRRSFVLQGALRSRIIAKLDMYNISINRLITTDASDCR